MWICMSGGWARSQISVKLHNWDLSRASWLVGSALTAEGGCCCLPSPAWHKGKRKDRCACVVLSEMALFGWLKNDFGCSPIPTPSKCQREQDTCLLQSWRHRPENDPREQRAEDFGVFFCFFKKVYPRGSILELSGDRCDPSCFLFLPPPLLLLSPSDYGRIPTSK